MTREIKFRAWDTIKIIFVDEGEITFYFYGDSHIEVHPNSITYIGDRVHNGEPEECRFIIQQYTGLKDKNGKEIFEGDIVKLSHPCWHVKCEVKYDEKLACFFCESLGKIDKGTKKSFLHILKEQSLTYKVIGNIYQNPELLGGEND
jgi:uncharacterized phage protein (TIGR01671 family)